MRLLYIANLRMPTEKAYGLQITQMCRAFAEADLDVTLAFPYRWNWSGKKIFDYYHIKKDFKARIIPSPDLYLPGVLDKFSTAFKNSISALFLAIYSFIGNFDIIYSRDELPLYILSFFKKNIVFEAHKFSKSRLKVYHRFNKMGIKIVVITGGIKKEFVDFGFDPARILVAHDGVDLGQFDIDMDKNEARRRLNLPSERKLIGYAGSFTTMGEHKGLDGLLEALKKINREDVNVVLVGGAVKKRDEEYYKDLAVTLGLKDKVIFTGRVEHKLVPLYLKAFDVLVMPFPYTTHYAYYMSPLKLFEYMASGRPIVSTDLPSVREILNEGNSILVKADDIRDLSEGLIRAIEDKSFSEKIAAKALSDVSELTWEKRVDRIINFCKNI